MATGLRLSIAWRSHAYLLPGNGTLFRKKYVLKSMGRERLSLDPVWIVPRITHKKIISMSKKSQFVVKLLKYKTMKNTQQERLQLPESRSRMLALRNRLTPLVCMHSSQHAQTWSDFHLFEYFPPHSERKKWDVPTWRPSGCVVRDGRWSSLSGFTQSVTSQFNFFLTCKIIF